MSTDAHVDTKRDQEMLQGLTIHTESVGMQVRDGEVALYVRPEAPRSSEDGAPVLMSAAAARRVRDLLNVATARGCL
jgi:hypothetical protein